MDLHNFQALAEELGDRAAWVEAQLARRQRHELQPQAAECLQSFAALRLRLARLAEVQPAEALEQSDALADLRSAGREIELQTPLVLFLLGARGPEIRLRRLVSALSAEINWPLRPPLVSCVSNGGFWTDPEPGLVYLPVGENHRLLGLPDLVHEMAHALFVHQPDALVGDFLSVVAEHADMLPTGAPHPPELADGVYRGWTVWLVEFVCDLVAAYIVGPAYAWQQLRLSATVSADVYAPVPPKVPGQHPADAARMLAIVAMLDRVAPSSDVEAVRRAWTAFLQWSPDVRPLVFDSVYPPALFEELAQRVLAGCDKSRITPYDHRDRWPTSVRGLIDTTWRRFLSNADGFGRFERNQVIAANSLLWLTSRR